MSSPSTTERVAGGRVTVRRTALGAPVEMLVESPRPAELVRSEAYARGWSATVTSLGPGGRSRTEPASDLGGLLQMVRLPAGKYLVSWHYRPQAVVEGELASLAGLLGALVLAAVAWPPGWPAPRRRRRVAPPERVGEG